VPGAILFDLDDTLIDRTGAFARLAAELVSRVPAGERERARETLIELDAGSDRDRDRLCREASARLRSLAMTPHELGETIASGIARHVAQAPRAAALLASLASRIPVAIVTNGSGAVQRAKLAAAGLPPVPVLISGEVGAEKPDRRIFEMALRAVGAEPGATVFVGDDPVRDVGGAAAAGMRTCWLGRGTYPADARMPDWRIRSLDELSGALPWT
jgi:putative hydrolase of the HAD superfamily